MIYVFLRAILRAVFAFLFRLKVEGVENIPSTGQVIMCSNHISNLDPPLLGSPFQRKIYYMAKEELFRVPFLGWLIPKIGAFPVKRGGVSKESIQTALHYLTEEKMLGIFPEGSRKATGAAKKGAAMLALRSEAVIVPAAIIGTYKPFRQMLIRYGTPIKLDEYRQNNSPDAAEKVTNVIMQAIENLKNQ